MSIVIFADSCPSIPFVCSSQSNLPVCVPFSPLAAFFRSSIFLPKHPKIFPLLRTPLLYRLVPCPSLVCIKATEVTGMQLNLTFQRLSTAWVRDFSNTYHAQTGRSRLEASAYKLNSHL
ncbi:hypothetical protein M378DRAFT_746981 [Amanita muscaria Koide BX008]|uniref:Uncharacterized protein n=1 Tax=Amanita muscaria (strain Koide BX008) TaxID=946122 RepID=A0A0C2X0N3_AMAMK|nr:hypothetical protein M378DRAFT_746981 [Amanita muscaria Koide BX008]